MLPPVKLPHRREEMPAPDDDDKPKKKIAHEIGQDLTLLSAGELADRIALRRRRLPGSGPIWRRSARSNRRPTAFSRSEFFQPSSARHIHSVLIA